MWLLHLFFINFSYYLCVYMVCGCVVVGIVVCIVQGGGRDQGRAHKSCLFPPSVGSEHPTWVIRLALQMLLTSNHTSHLGHIVTLHILHPREGENFRSSYYRIAFQDVRIITIKGNCFTYPYLWLVCISK